MATDDPRDLEIAELKQELARLRAENAELRELLEDLRAQLNKNSLNSSLPPSRDNKDAREKRRDRAAKHARKRAKEARKKNRAKRTLLPPESVTSSEDHHPSHCVDCGTHLRRTDMLNEPERFQQIDLPPVRLLVHETRVHSARCPCCDTVTRAAQPDSATASKVGPSMRAMLMLLIGRFHLSRREAAEFIADVFGPDFSLGLVSKIEHQTSTTLAPIVERAAQVVQTAPVVHADETSWSVGGIPHWLWVATTGHVAVFSIAPGRGKKEARALLGDREEGVTVSDRWVAYEGMGRRQVCWAHLERNAQALVERGGVAATVGNRVVMFVREMFSLWHRFLDEEISRRTLRTRVKKLAANMFEFIRLVCTSSKPAKSFVRGLHAAEDHLFTFTEVEGVEPTNNPAERHVRPAVMWRRKSQGTQSERGCRFVERMLSVAVSCRAQGRSVFEFLRRLLTPDERNPSLLRA